MTDPGEPQFVLSEADLRALAMELQKSGLTFDPARGRKGIVTAVNLATSPPTVTLQLSGDTTVSIPDVRVMRSYTPAVNDTAVLLDQGNELLALGTVASSSYGIGTTNLVHYSRTTTFTCGHNIIEKVIFPTAVTTDTSTVTVTSNQDFNLVRAGCYDIVVNLPWAANATGSRWGLVGASSTSNTRYAVQESNPSNGAAAPQNLTVPPQRFAANTSISVYAYQDSGANLTLFPTTSTGPLNIGIYYKGP